MAFDFTKTEIPEVVLITPRFFPDDRGFFMETYKKSEFSRAGIEAEFVQDNHSRSVRGVLRGLHYQLPPFAQGKLVRCLRGEVWDVAVDIRRGSPSFGRWTSVILSAENRNMLYIPPGFAHGFYTLSAEAELAYKVTAEYAKPQERGIIWNDGTLKVSWPVGPVSLSEKDLCNPPLAEAEVFA